VTHDEIKSAIAEGVAAAFKNSDLHCRYNITPDEHAAQHKAITEFLATMARIDGIKWEVAKKLATYAAVGLVVLVGYGALGQIGKLLGIIK